MINVSLVLSIGHLKSGKFHAYDEYDMEINSWEEFTSSSKPCVDCDNINSILNDYKDLDEVNCDWAELVLRLSFKESPMLLGSFRRVKIKGKGYKWLVVE